jgi:hypothetical protein
LIGRELVKGSPIRGCMARQSKASRGKFRWLGLRIDRGDLSRVSASKIIGENLPDIDFKLFDSISTESDTLAIIRLKLEYNDYAREKLASNPNINTLTTSGKIRLVRQRLGLARPPRK